jgi:hypothetical protein
MSGLGSPYNVGQMAAQQQPNPLLDPQGQQDQQNMQNRIRLIQSMMGPQQNTNTTWGGLANAGSQIAGAMAQRGLQGQQQQNWQNQAARQTPNMQTQAGSLSPAGPQLPQKASLLSGLFQ